MDNLARKGVEMNYERKIKEAIKLALNYGDIDSAHHKSWTIDQMVRILAGDNYDRVIEEHRDGEHGPDTYYWDEGIAP
ncbi:MAG: hypothetical protein V3W37_08920 [Candidatus Binatia bacterium]